MFSWWLFDHNFQRLTEKNEKRGARNREKGIPRRRYEEGAS